MNKLEKSKNEMMARMVTADVAELSTYYGDIEAASLDKINGDQMKFNYIHNFAVSVAGSLLAHAVINGYPKKEIIRFVTAMMNSWLDADNQAKEAVYGSD